MDLYLTTLDSDPTSEVGQTQMREDEVEKEDLVVEDVGCSVFVPENGWVLHLAGEEF